MRGRRSGYVWVLNLVSFGDFGLIFDLYSVGMQDSLSSEGFLGISMMGCGS